MKVHKKRIRLLIKQMLETHPHLRNEDEKLASNVLYLFLSGIGINSQKISAFEFLQMYAENQLPTIDYITRIRRKIQEENEHLRGTNYKARKLKCQTIKKHKEEIHEIL